MIINNVRTMKFLGIDSCNRPVYKCVENGVLWKDVTRGQGEPKLYSSCYNAFDGEPDCPINKDLEIHYFGKDKENKYQSSYKENKYKFRYLLLDRMKCDCEAHLGVSNRKISDIEKHISEMKDIYNSLPLGEKPEWLSWEDILNFEKEMWLIHNKVILLEKRRDEEK